MQQNLMRIAPFAREQGFTEPQVRYWITTYPDLQKTGAVLRIGRSVFIDPVKFRTWLEALQARYSHAGGQ